MTVIDRTIHEDGLEFVNHSIGCMYATSTVIPRRVATQRIINGIYIADPTLRIALAVYPEPLAELTGAVILV